MDPEHKTVLGDFLDNLKKTMAVVEKHKLKLDNKEELLLIDFTLNQKPCIPEMFPSVLYGYRRKKIPNAKSPDDYLYEKMEKLDPERETVLGDFLDNLKKTMAAVEEQNLKLDDKEQRLLIDLTLNQKAYIPEKEAYIPEMFPAFLYGYRIKRMDNAALSQGIEELRTQADAVIASEKGEVPHSRDLCPVYPFKKTPHAIHCKMCYCYVCDGPAPCNKWTEGRQEGCSDFNAKYVKHCDATPADLIWKIKSDFVKKYKSRGC